MDREGVRVDWSRERERGCEGVKVERERMWEREGVEWGEREGESGEKWEERERVVVGREF